jgi:hypothetical protein
MLLEDLPSPQVTSFHHHQWVLEPRGDAPEPVVVDLSLQRVQVVLIELVQVIVCVYLPAIAEGL